MTRTEVLRSHPHGSTSLAGREASPCSSTRRPSTSTSSSSTATFYVAVALILALEYVLPAKPDQRPLSVHLAQDFVWFLLETGLKSVVIVTWMRMIAALYTEHLSALTITAMYGLPLAARVVLGVLLVDLIGWFQHWVRHKVLERALGRAGKTLRLRELALGAFAARYGGPRCLTLPLLRSNGATIR